MVIFQQLARSEKGKLLTCWLVANLSWSTPRAYLHSIVSSCLCCRRGELGPDDDSWTGASSSEGQGRDQVTVRDAIHPCVIGYCDGGCVELMRSGACVVRQEGSVMTGEGQSVVTAANEGGEGKGGRRWGDV